MSVHKPYISARQKVPEFTLKAILFGVALGLVFGIGNAYLGLKMGTTVSASIPAAVLSMALLKRLFRRTSILENNLVQTIATVGEGLASGVIFTVPALFFLGAPICPGRIFLLAALGGVLGILFMIPMRRYIIVQEHGKFPFPEGTACAEILKSGAAAEGSASHAFWGILIGAAYKIASGGLFLFKEVPQWIITPFQRVLFSIDCTPALLGVGYLIGPRMASLLLAGGAMGWWVLIPLIRLFGADSIVYPGTEPIAQMATDEIWSKYIRYIGAGAIAVGGMFSLVRITPILRKTLNASFRELFQFRSAAASIRTDRDISLRWLLGGSLAIILALWLFPGFPMNFLTIVLLVCLGFFFVAVTSLTVGMIGSTSNPVSGMTITVLLVTCVIFVALGWTERIYLISALTMSVVVNVAIALAGTTSQDLKTGFLLGATPRWQQVGELIGIVVPAAALGGTLYLLNAAYHLGSSQMPAPQATMMALIAQGVIEGQIPLMLVVVGGMIGLILELFRVPILPFALGLYLPLSLSTATVAGGLVSWFVRRRSSSTETFEKGILGASGLIAGDAITGVVIALLAVIGFIPIEAPALLPDWASLILFGGLAIWLCSVASRGSSQLD